MGALNIPKDRASLFFCCSYLGIPLSHPSSGVAEKRASYSIVCPLESQCCLIVFSMGHLTPFTCTHTKTHQSAHAHIHTQMHMGMQVRTRAHTQNACTQANTNRHTHTHASTRTPTHTHTTHPPVPIHIVCLFYSSLTRFRVFSLGCVCGCLAEGLGW